MGIVIDVIMPDTHAEFADVMQVRRRYHTGRTDGWREQFY
jgi:hypothetical protein